ncbi:hypothetical protein [Pelosinus propionicus]|uniref:Uncharacterized protein n=1 Tax=Pelosinus propionicus DSM 13327 TaxID=1123291 RepID=A0A1I4P8F2_9FIRM|nr:hypothetical protein [Pelosinus propionicus]SFM23880.1 hypothetical protein SAMN04490355_105915 [Pelosinus propionicus DSM 13327]
MIRKLELNEIACELGLSGKTLATRPVGEQFYLLALKRLDKINVGDVIEVSLAGIQATDTSFLDEFVLGFQRLILDSYPDSMIFVSNVDIWVFENLTRLIKSWEVDGLRIPVLCFHNDKYEIVGKMEANLLEAFDVCLINKEVTARQLSETKNLVLSTASTRLRKLYEFRVIYRREVIDSFGKQYVYTLPR